MNVNIALLTVTDTRTFDNDKSGAILVEKIKEANHNLIDRKICKDNKEDIVKTMTKNIEIETLLFETKWELHGLINQNKSEEINVISFIPGILKV